MATHKRLNVVVDGSTAMGAYWRTLVFPYLENIVRCFFAQSTGKDTAKATFELGLTVYGVREDYYPVHVTNWTTNLELFLEALSTLTFNCGGGANEEPAIAEGLAGALLMLSKPLNGRPSKEYYACERHCILVAATGPIPMPSPLFVPRIHEGRVCGDQAEWRMVDAMEVAHMFPEYAVSLSVASPHQLPLLREIFIQGNHITEGSNTGVLKFRNGGQLLLLLSDKFLEACNAVKHVQASEFAQGEENLLLQQRCLKEHDKFNGSSSAKKHVEPNPASSQWSVPNSDYASSSNTPCNPNDMSIYADIIAELDAGIVVLSPSTPVTRGNLFDELKRLRAELSYAGVIGRKQTEAMSRIPGSEMSLQQRMKNMDPKSIARSRRHALQKNKRLAKQASMPLTHRAMKSAKRTDHRRRVKKFRSLSMIAPVYNATQRPLHTMSSRVVMNASATGDSSMVVSQCASLSRSIGTQQCSSYASSSSAIDTRAESSRMGSQRTETNASGELSIQTNANTDITMVDITEESDDEIAPPPVEMPERNHEGHVLAWGGRISAIYKGQGVLICTAKAYRSITSRETLTDGWPESIQVKKIRRQNDIKNKIIANHWRAHYLIIDVTTSHKVIHEKLISRQLCAKVMFANNQVMYIVPTKGIQHFIGILYDENI